MSNTFSTAADRELCRATVQRVSTRFTTALKAIIALHRSGRDPSGRRCDLCDEDWPCRTVALATCAHQGGPT